MHTNLTIENWLLKVSAESGIPVDLLRPQPKQENKKSDNKKKRGKEYEVKNR